MTTPLDSFTCIGCGGPLESPGAVLLSPPLPHIAAAKRVPVFKDHICVRCHPLYEALAGKLQRRWVCRAKEGLLRCHDEAGLMIMKPEHQGCGPAALTIEVVVS